MKLENIKKRLKSLLIDEVDTIDFDNLEKSEISEFIESKRNEIILEIEKLISKMSDGKVNNLSNFNKGKVQVKYYEPKLPLLLIKCHLLANLLLDLTKTQK